MTDLVVKKSAVLSDDLVYRHRLDRDLGTGGPVAAICGVNPSTADHELDDHTIRKDMGFASRLGWGRIIKVNEFDFRAKDVNALKTAAKPCSGVNDRYLREAFEEAEFVVFAWGPLAKLPKHLRTRWKRVAEIAHEAGKTPKCWGVVSDGHPCHTLTLAYTTPLIDWRRP